MYLSDFLFDINSTLKVVNMHLQNKSFVLSLYQSTLPYKLSNIFLFFLINIQSIVSIKQIDKFICFEIK